MDWLPEIHWRLMELSTINSQPQPTVCRARTWGKVLPRIIISVHVWLAGALLFISLPKGRKGKKRLVGCDEFSFNLLKSVSGFDSKQGFVDDQYVRNKERCRQKSRPRPLLFQVH